MSKRIDIERQAQLEPLRIGVAKKMLTEMGFEILKETSTFLQFKYKEHVVTFFPYSGWHSGKSIKDGRGLNNLLKQIGSNQ